MNARRSEPITLRYFQYLAVLYAEVFLDGYFNRRGRDTPLRLMILSLITMPVSRFPNPT